AWLACVRIAEDAINRGVAVPNALRQWLVSVVRDEAKRPDRRRKAPVRAARDDAIRFAVRLAMERGAFQAPTHSRNKTTPGAELVGPRAHSACELVAQRFSSAGVGIALSYGEVERIWGKRERNLDSVRAEKK